MADVTPSSLQIVFPLEDPDGKPWRLPDKSVGERAVNAEAGELLQRGRLEAVALHDPWKANKGKTLERIYSSDL